MHKELQEMIELVKASGSITDKQRELILMKAKQMGEDVDNVEFILETIRPEQSKIKKRKCSYCGAMVPAMELKCPECGNLMEQEADSSRNNRNFIAELQQRLNEISAQSARSDEDKYDLEDRIEEERADAIGSFTVPLTKESLIMAYNHCYGNYSRMNDDDHRDEARAWLAKAKEFYSTLESMPNLDVETQNWLTANKVKNKAKVKDNDWIDMILAFIIIAFLFCLPIIFKLIDSIIEKI